MTNNIERLILYPLFFGLLVIGGLFYLGWLLAMAVAGLADWVRGDV